jgi:PAS domain-containing protein
MLGAIGRSYTISLGLIAAFVVGGAIAGLMRLHALGAAEPLWIGGAMVFIIAVLMGLWSLHGSIIHHLTTLERLRAGVLVAAIGKDGRLPPPPRTGPGDDADVSRMREALETLLSRRLAPATPDDRLKAVLATLDEGIVVITESGQVSLVNAPAKAMLGSVRVALGTSVFAGLERDPLLAAWDTARKSGGAGLRDVVHGEHTVVGRVGLTVDGLHETVAKDAVVLLERGDDQLFLGAEVVIHRLFRDLGFLGDPVDAGRMVAMLGEQLDGRLHELLALRRACRVYSSVTLDCHSASPKDLNRRPF